MKNMKHILNFVDGAVLSVIIVNFGYKLLSWQWWAWMTIGITYMYVHSILARKIK